MLCGENTQSRSLGPPAFFVPPLHPTPAMYEAGSPPSSPPIPLSFTQDMYYGDDEDPDITIHTTPPSFTYRWDPTYKNISSSTNRTFVFTNWPGLLTCISTLLLQPCNYSGPFYSGSRNILRRIVSGDGKNWIVRIPTIPDGCRDPNSKDWWTKERRTAFESEIATLRWVRENTPIPVPEVEGYCPVAEGKAEMPWMLLTALKGHCIKDILDSRSRPLDSQETHRIMNAVAWVQVRTPLPLVPPSHPPRTPLLTPPSR